MFIYNVVPTPVLSIFPSTTSVYAGSFITVNCSIQLSSAVDSQVTVSAVWRKNGIMLRSSTNRMLIDPTSIGNSSHLAQIVFSPVQLSSDDGVYACEVTVSAEGNDFVLSSSLNSTNITLHSTGMLLLTCIIMTRGHFYTYNHISSHADRGDAITNRNCT